MKAYKWTGFNLYCQQRSETSWEKIWTLRGYWSVEVRPGNMEQYLAIKPATVIEEITPESYERLRKLVLNKINNLSCHTCQHYNRPKSNMPCCECYKFSWYKQK